MSKKELKNEINRYIAFGYSIEDSCMQVNNLYLNEHLSKIYQIQNEMLAKAAK